MYHLKLNEAQMFAIRSIVLAFCRLEGDTEWEDIVSREKTDLNEILTMVMNLKEE